MLNLNSDFKKLSEWSYNFEIFIKSRKLYVRFSDLFWMFQIYLFANKLSLLNFWDFKSFSNGIRNLFWLGPSYIGRELIIVQLFNL